MFLAHPAHSQTQMPIHWEPIFVLIGVATAWDLACRRIPNWLTVPFLISGLAWTAAMGGWASLLSALAGVGVAIAAFGPFCWLGAMGWGDLKLAAAIGVWIGPDKLFFALVVAALAGGVIALGYAIRRGMLRHSLDRTAAVLRGRGESPGAANPVEVAAQSIPYAPAIAIGTVFAFLASHV